MVYGVTAIFRFKLKSLTQYWSK